MQQIISSGSAVKLLQTIWVPATRTLVLGPAWFLKSTCRNITCNLPVDCRWAKRWQFDVACDDKALQEIVCRMLIAVHRKTDNG